MARTEVEESNNNESSRQRSQRGNVRGKENKSSCSDSGSKSFEETDSSCTGSSSEDEEDEEDYRPGTKIVL